MQPLPTNNQVDIGEFVDVREAIACGIEFRGDVAQGVFGLDGIEGIGAHPTGANDRLASTIGIIIQLPPRPSIRDSEASG